MYSNSSIINNYIQLNKQNLYFCDFINKYEGELAREEFYQISIDYMDQFRGGHHYKLIKPEAENFDFALFDEQHKEISKQIEEKWLNGLDEPIPLYLSLSDMGICFYKVFAFTDEISYLLLQLPTFIRNKGDMKIVYYYLNKLFNCSFECNRANEFIFNPELIELLFGNTKQIYIQESYYYFNKSNAEKLLKFILNHFIFGSLKIIFPTEDDEEYTNIEEYINVLSKILINGDKCKSITLSNQPQYFNFIINVSFDSM
ncbi:unnamed protein product [Meloidogyne enterolobii]|uniref:Uncharacterized protein n=1 Tax=Meloidogyne enterolobii TaxID=390850 RepID=A0ACB0YPR7_MELEN